MSCNTLKERINAYRILLDSLDLSPFELRMAFLLRSDLEEEKAEMTKEELTKLHNYDQAILKDLKAYKLHLGKIHDFNNTNKPESHWWWHLNKIKRDI